MRLVSSGYLPRGSGAFLPAWLSLWHVSQSGSSSDFGGEAAEIMVGRRSLMLLQKRAFSQQGGAVSERVIERRIFAPEI